MKHAVFVLAALVLVLSGRAFSTTIYVDDDAPNDPGPGDPAVSDPLEAGSADHPFDAIQEGIDAAIAGDTVLVKDGTYTGDGNRNLDFGGKAITVQSENGAATCIIDCENAGRGFYFHSVEDATSVVDGLTITNGSDGSGGGICCESNSSPAITACTISSNTASNGGGIYCESNSSPAITNCTISDNTANNGGAICCWESSSTITNCTISGNTSDNGGGICCLDSSPAISNCTMSGNTSRGANGGGIYCESSSPAITNCTITGSDEGGGICCCVNSSPAISNCTISGNTANDGGGINCWENSSPTITNCTISGNTSDNGGGVCCLDSSPTVTNCVLWANTAAEGHEIAMYYTETPSVLTVRYSDVQGGVAEAHADPGCTLDLDGTCIDADPLFVGSLPHSYYLSQTAAGQGADSPCVDTGSDTAANLGLDALTTRTDGVPDEGVVDMGYHAPPAPHIYAITHVGDDVTLWWNGLAGVSYVVEWSPDRFTWNDVPVGAVELWTDVGALTGARRFYRVRGAAASPAPAPSPSTDLSGSHHPAVSVHTSDRSGNVRVSAGNVHAR